jgi:hypothetical protein
LRAVHRHPCRNPESSGVTDARRYLHDVFSAALTTNIESLESNALSSGSSSVVEHRLAKARVASSNLVSRSKNQGKSKKEKGKTLNLDLLPFYFLLLPSLLGGVAKW